MTDESVTNAQLHTTTRGVDRRSVYIDEHNNNFNKSSRKFRWSSCFSFISSKFKKSKSQKIPAADELERERHDVSENITAETIEDAVVVKATGTSWKQQQQQQQHHQHQPTASLSPPPRQTKNKRDSSLSQLQTKNDNGNSTKDRRPLVDPTLTPRVKPRSIKTKKQPSLLRLSLDAELLQQQSPDGIFYDNDSSTTSTCKTGHSSFTFTPTSATQYPPFRSGTLGAVKNGKPRLSTSTNESDIPPLPLPRINIASGFDKSSSRPDSQSTTHTNLSFVTDSPSSISAIDGMIPNVDDEEKLTLKERRHRRSPLSMPDTNQLTLALKSFKSETELDYVQQPAETKREQYQEPHVDISTGDEEELMWRQQLLEQTIAFSLQNKSRQDAMLTLEGKKTRGYQPVVTVRQLNGHYDDDDDSETITTANINGDLVKDKAQYDAIVSRTHKRQLSSHEDGNYNNSNIYRTSLQTESSTNKKKDSAPTTITSNHLDIISENEIANNVTTPMSTNKMLLFHGQHLSVAPETPSPHQQNAPSLISAPSTPNSIDSSVLEDDYLNDRLHNLAAFIHPS